MLIGKKYKVDSDSFGITLYESVNVKKTGCIRWQPLAYFASVKNALEYLVDREVRMTGLKDFQTVVEKQKELYQLIKELEHI